MDWFLYDNGLRHESVNNSQSAKLRGMREFVDYVGRVGTQICAFMSGTFAWVEGVTWVYKMFV